jgi:hypothetical protein
VEARHHAKVVAATPTGAAFQRNFGQFLSDLVEGRVDRLIMAPSFIFEESVSAILPAFMDPNIVIDLEVQE